MCQSKVLRVLVIILFFLLSVQAASASIEYGDGWRKICDDVGKCQFSNYHTIQRWDDHRNNGDSKQACTGCNMTIWNATTGAYITSLNITSGVTNSTSVSHIFGRGWNYRYSTEAITSGVTRLTFNIQVTKE